MDFRFKALGPPVAKAVGDIGSSRAADRYEIPSDPSFVEGADGGRLHSWSVKQFVFTMKTASVREVRQNFGHLLTWLEEGQEIQITMHRRVVARLIPDRARTADRVKMPDFVGRINLLQFLRFS